MQTPLSELSRVQSQLLDDENVLVLTKARFFQTLRTLLDYAQHPERRTWESFSYRSWQYILGTYCLTFNLNHWAVSCGPQHASIRRTAIPNPHGTDIKFRLEWAQPDFTLMSNAFGKEGQLLFLGEAKPMGKVEPDTVDARRMASTIFLEIESQRQRQALFTFERHPESDVIKILMICGSIWSVWTYNRSEFTQDPLPAASDGEELLTDGQNPPSPTGLDDHASSSPDRSPPHKLRRKDITDRSDRYRRRFESKSDSASVNRFRRGQNNEHDASGSDGHDDLSPVPSPPSNRKDSTWRPNPEEEPLEIDVEWEHGPLKNRKGKKKARKGPTGVPSTPQRRNQPDVHHVLRLPNKDELNPWFRQFLQQSRDTLIGELADQGSVQRSWFDWPADVVPDGDGHAPGYVLPTMQRPTQESEPQPEFVEIIRVDAPPEAMNTSGSGLSQAAVNAMMSPGINPSAVFRHASVTYTPAFSHNTVPLRRREFFTVEEEDTVLPQLPEAQSSDVEYDPSPSPATEQHRPTQPAQRRDIREASPTDLYLERKQQGLRLDSVAFAQPLPSNHASTSRDDNASADIIGGGASTETPNNDAPPAPSTSAVATLPSSTAVVDSHASTTGRVSSKERQGANRSLQDRSIERNREEYLAYLQEMSLGPLRAKNLPNGGPLPEDFAKMSRADQEMCIFLNVPKEPRKKKDYAKGLRATGMPKAQIRQMLYSIQDRAARSALSSVPPDDPSASRLRTGGVQHCSSVAAAVLPQQHPVSLPGPAEEPAPQSDGNGDTQTPRPRRASLAPASGPSVTTISDRASDGATSSSSRSAGPTAGGHNESSAERVPQEPHRPQTANPPDPQRRRDPVATTTARLETLHLDPRPSGSDPAGEGNANRKRKER